MSCFYSFALVFCDSEQFVSKSIPLNVKKYFVSFRNRDFENVLSAFDDLVFFVFAFDLFITRGISKMSSHN